MSTYSEQLFNESNQHQLLNADEELALLIKARKGDLRAKDKLMQLNQRLVAKIARKHWHTMSFESHNGGEEFMDLVQVGNLGLMRAIEKYDPAFETRLSTYATKWINSKIWRHRTTKGLLMRPTTISKTYDLLKVRASEAFLLQIVGHTPLPSEISEASGLPEKLVIELLNLRKPLIRLDDPIDNSLENDGETLLNTIPDTAPSPEEQTECNLLSEDMDMVLSKLHPRLKTILVLRYGLDGGGERPLVEIAQVLNITRARVGQLLQMALSCLRSVHGDELYEMFY